MNYNNHSMEGDIPEYRADFSPERNRLQLAKPSRLAVQHRAHLLESPKPVMIFHLK